MTNMRSKFHAEAVGAMTDLKDSFGAGVARNLMSLLRIEKLTEITDQRLIDAAYYSAIGAHHFIMNNGLTVLPVNVTVDTLEEIGRVYESRMQGVKELSRKAYVPDPPSGPPLPVPADPAAFPSHVRLPTQIACAPDSTLYVLANDGTMWERDNEGGWIGIQELPQP